MSLPLELVKVTNIPEESIIFNTEDNNYYYVNNNVSETHGRTRVNCLVVNIMAWSFYLDDRTGKGEALIDVITDHVHIWENIPQDTYYWVVS